MEFLTDLHLLNPDAIRKRFDEYGQYLKSVQPQLPPGVYDFATAPGHYDDGRLGLHDAWVQCLSISEIAPEENSQHRAIEILVRLLGAYQDKQVEMIYEGVQSYSLNTPPESSSPTLYRTGHGDWLIDEIRLSERNLVIHEIEFSRGGRWIIECENIQYVSTPKVL